MVKLPVSAVAFTSMNVSSGHIGNVGETVGTFVGEIEGFVVGVAEGDIDGMIVGD